MQTRRAILEADPSTTGRRHFLGEQDEGSFVFLDANLELLICPSDQLPGARDRNPIVLATFQANLPHGHPTSKLAPSSPRRRVLFYGHYDVVTASADHWQLPPFQLTGQDGFLYGRGVSDNKGPILAIAAAASELRSKGQLGVDVVMVIEGEEESGSAGFQDAIRAHRVSCKALRRADLVKIEELTLALSSGPTQDLIGEIDVILVSNSYWIGEEVPCLTYGLRGVVHATLTVRTGTVPQRWSSPH